VANIKHRSVKSLHRTHAKDTEAKHKKKENNMQLKNLWLNYENDDDETPTTNEENTMTNKALTEAEKNNLIEQTFPRAKQGEQFFNTMKEQDDAQIIYSWAEELTERENGGNEAVHRWTSDEEKTISGDDFTDAINKKITDYRDARENPVVEIQDGKSVSTKTEEQEPFDYLAMLDNVSAQAQQAEPQTTKGEHHDTTTKTRANTLRVQ
jgi:hypothetical protein